MTNRWDANVKIGGEKVGLFFGEHFTKPDKKLLYILGKGFDVRMNTMLSMLLEASPSVVIESILIDYSGGTKSPYEDLVKDNMEDLDALLKDRAFETKSIALFNGSGNQRKWTGDKNVIDVIPEIEGFTDIIIDISALQRSVYPTLIGTLLSLIDTNALNINLFVGVTENAQIDALITETGAEQDLRYLHGFGGNIDVTAESEKPIIWFPFLGEGKTEQLKKAQDHFLDHSRSYEICPVLPFPSKDLRRSDSLMIEYHTWLFDSSSVASKDIIYVPEQNPFEAYIRLNSAIRNYYQSLRPLDGCKAVISNFSSKLLSIGSILCAYELKKEIGVGLLNVPSEGYKIENEQEMKNLKSESQPFLMWLTGDPYK